MADTDFNALAPTTTIAATDSIVVVRGSVPYRFTGVLPAIAANGDMTLGSAVALGKLSIRGRATETASLATAASNAALLLQTYSGSAWGLAFGSLTGQIQSIQGVDTGSATARAVAINYLGGNVIMNVNGGNLLVGVASHTSHAILKSVSEGGEILIVGAPGLNPIRFYGATGTGYSAAGAAIHVTRNTTTLRSINAGGTVNASGADYAEYLRKALAYLDWAFSKCQVLGINDDGELTPRWSEAHSFVIKSYDPAYVGGDTWSQHLGPKPEAPAEHGLALPWVPVAPPAFDQPIPTRSDGEADELFGMRMAEWLIASRAAADAQEKYAREIAAYPDEMAQWTAAQDAFDAAQAAYEAALPLWEAAMEEARAIVDRIAFSGQVPVIVEGDYAPGQYLVAHEGPDDTIICRAHDLAELLADPALAFRKVGKVWAVREVKRNPADDSETPEMVTRAWANVLHS